RIELVERDARLHDGDVVLGIDLDDAVHPFEREHDAVGAGHTRARQPGTRTTGGHRYCEFVADTEYGRDLAGRRGLHHGPWPRGSRGQGLVTRVVVLDGVAPENVRLPHNAAQLRLEIRHRSCVGPDDAAVKPSTEHELGRLSPDANDAHVRYRNRISRTFCGAPRRTSGEPLMQSNVDGSVRAEAAGEALMRASRALGAITARSLSSLSAGGARP